MNREENSGSDLKGASDCPYCGYPKALHDYASRTSCVIGSPPVESNSARSMDADEMADAVIDGEQVVVPDGQRPVEQKGATDRLARIEETLGQLVTDGMGVHV